MFDFIIDINPLMRFMVGLSAQTSQIESEVADAAYRHWRQLAQARLRTSKDRYLSGLQAPQPTMNGVEISLVGVFPNMVENGEGPFDMRDTMLGPGDDEFRVIAFKYTGPGTNPTDTTTPLGWAAREANVGDPKGYASWSKPEDPRGWRAVGSMIRSMFNKHEMHAPHLGGFARPVSARIFLSRRGDQHKHRMQQSHAHALRRIDAGTQHDPLDVANLWHFNPLQRRRTGLDVYGGLQRQQGGHEGSHATFRTISRKSTTGWMHPGISARRLLDDVEANLPGATYRVVDAAVDRAVKLANGEGLA